MEEGRLWCSDYKWTPVHWSKASWGKWGKCGFVPVIVMSFGERHCDCCKKFPALRCPRVAQWSQQWPPVLSPASGCCIPMGSGSALLWACQQLTPRVMCFCHLFLWAKKTLKWSWNIHLFLSFFPSFFLVFPPLSLFLMTWIWNHTFNNCIHDLKLNKHFA